DSPHFVTTLAALTGGHLSRSSNIEVFANGENYYKAELEAIASAQRTICLEAYIFESGEVTRQFLNALRERALAGVTVNLIVDAVGSYGFPEAEAEPLRAAGGKFARYLPPRWYTWPRMNNRTHRELLIIDGRLAFVGGAGWADHWLKPKERAERWRDTMVRVQGDAATGLQAAFAENWLEATGDILTGDGYFPIKPGAGPSAAIVVRSSPGMGRSTPARVLFQVLLASARKRIYLTTPYFLPDANIREEIARAIRERGVEVKIITPGPGTDHLLTRHSSRRLYGPLLEAGAHIYEYQPSMMHAKILMVDSQWAVVGSTNIDPRSFSLNVEVNLATPDPKVTQRLEQDFAGDLKRSREISHSEWKQRGIMERLHESFGSLIERQQ
ncbi:MAG TPA: phospholipase D-like domain-containing protein, partial [Bryobacteraceae bacterium]|nr:phospholipase D-like domain-containing protein [Bryobacteraceae bacterium]